MGAIYKSGICYGGGGGGGSAGPQLDALAALLGATYNESTNEYVFNGLDPEFQADPATVVNLLNEIKGQIDELSGLANPSVQGTTLQLY